MSETIDTPLVSRKAMQKHLQKIHIQNGDVVLVKAGTAAAKQEIIDGVVKALTRLGKKDIILVVVDDFHDLSVLNEQEMNQHGWFRLPQLRRLVHTAKDGEDEKEKPPAA